MNTSGSRAASQVDGRVSFRKKRWLGWLAISAGLLAAGFVFSFPIDFSVYRQMQQMDCPLFQQIAQQFSFWGDYIPGSILVSLLLSVGGRIAKSHRARSAALASFLAASAAGISLDAGRFSFGRPRPYATAQAAILRLGHKPEMQISFGRTRADNDLPDGLYGPVGIHMFQGFPSGHAASSTASAAAVIRLLPRLGSSVGLLALGICWSRMELRQHYLSDVVVGAIWGALWGMLFSTLLGRRLPRCATAPPASRPEKEI
ncbi:phosphatase PAP2 family protein [Verrucomicrobium sp. 3C]|uniref:phosphatase PAP2 family protein n=1 Tax=Verrucomicrobium sp. 3C TaxID=1134055 RepID=UPI00036DB74E|nr:phosphatase PAP2 family protein [Verrucomicrobium sp. 3C]